MTFDFWDPVHFVTFLFGVILLLKRVAEMDRYHKLRVIVLTSILSCIAIYFFLAYGFTLGSPRPFDCHISFEG